MEKNEEFCIHYFLSYGNRGRWWFRFFIFFCFFRGVNIEIMFQFFFGRDKFFASGEMTQMEDGREAFVIFVVFTVETVTIYSLLHKITSGNNKVVFQFG